MISLNLPQFSCFFYPLFDNGDKCILPNNKDAEKGSRTLEPLLEQILSLSPLTTWLPPHVADLFLCIYYYNLVLSLESI